MHLSLLLDMAADAMGDRRAVTAPEGELTYAELRDAAVAAAGALAGPGGRTVQLGVNSLAVPIALLGASQAGSAFTPLNYRLADADLRRIAERAAPAVAVVDDDMVSRLDGVEGLDVITTSALLAGSLDAPSSRGRSRSPTTCSSCCSPRARRASPRRRCCATAT